MHPWPNCLPTVAKEITSATASAYEYAGDASDHPPLARGEGSALAHRPACPGQDQHLLPSLRVN